MPAPRPATRVAIAASLLLAACASSGPVPTLALDPPVAAVAPGETVAFAAEVAGSDEPVVWQVVEREGGRIDETGSYTAPEVEGTFHVSAWVGTADTLRTAEIRVRRTAGRGTAAQARSGEGRPARGRRALSG